MKLENQMVKGHSLHLMEISMKENGRMVKKHGQGTYIWSNGEKYEGEWKDGLIHGQGTYNWSYGKKYEGEEERERMELNKLRQIR